MIKIDKWHAEVSETHNEFNNWLKIIFCPPALFSYSRRNTVSDYLYCLKYLYEQLGKLLKRDKRDSDEHHDPETLKISQLIPVIVVSSYLAEIESK